MTVYVNERCRSCGTSLTGWIPNYYVVEVPFVVCPSCRVPNDRSAKANEWDLSTSGRKLAHALLSLYWGLAYGVAFAALIGYVAMNASPSLENLSVTSPEVLLSILDGFALGLISSYGALYRKIRQSRNRLVDVKYRDTLKRYGYLAEHRE